MPRYSEFEGPLRQMYNMPRFVGAIGLGVCTLDVASLVVQGSSSGQIDRVVEGGLIIYGGAELLGRLIKGADYLMDRFFGEEETEQLS